MVPHLGLTNSTCHHFASKPLFINMHRIEYVRITLTIVFQLHMQYSIQVSCWSLVMLVLVLASWAVKNFSNEFAMVQCIVCLFFGNVLNCFFDCFSIPFFPFSPVVFFDKITFSTNLLSECKSFACPIGRQFVKVQVHCAIFGGFWITLIFGFFQNK